MPQIEREYLHLSSGLDYMEFHYFDINGNPIDKKKAVKCVIYECAKDGTVLRQLEGDVKQGVTQRLLDKGTKLGHVVKKNMSIASLANLFSRSKNNNM